MNRKTVSRRAVARHQPLAFEHGLSLASGEAIGLHHLLRLGEADDDRDAVPFGRSAGHGLRGCGQHASPRAAIRETATVQAFAAARELAFSLFHAASAACAVRAYSLSSSCVAVSAVNSSRMPFGSKK